MADTESVLMFVQAQNQPLPPFPQTLLWCKTYAMLGDFQGDECDALSAIRENKAQWENNNSKQISLLKFTPSQNALIELEGLEEGKKHSIEFLLIFSLRFLILHFLAAPFLSFITSLLFTGWLRSYCENSKLEDQARLWFCPNKDILQVTKILGLCHYTLKDMCIIIKSFGIWNICDNLLLLKI